MKRAPKRRRRPWHQAELYGLDAIDYVWGLIKKRIGRFVPGRSEFRKGKFTCPLCEQCKIKWYRTATTGLVYAHCDTLSCVKIPGMRFRF